MLGSSILLSVAQFLAMLFCLECGYRLGRRRWHREETDPAALNVVEAAIFALFGLLLAFAFAGALSRLDVRRDLIVSEANAISTAYLRIDLLATERQAAMRSQFHDYLDARLRAFEEIDAGRDATQAMAAVNAIQQKIWIEAVAGTRNDANDNVARLLLPAINEMIDVTTARTVALHTHIPGLILVLLLGVTLLSSLMAGYAMARHRRRSFIHAVLFAATVSLTIYTVLDLDDPRRGLIRLDAAEEALRQLQRAI